MKFRSLVVLFAAALLMIVGCGDDITNIIGDIPPTQGPDSSPTAVPPTNTPTPAEVPPTPTVPGPQICSDPAEGTTPVCGDGNCEAPEQCDIGGICVGGANDLAACHSPGDCDGGRCTVVGGQETDGGTCSANCTMENRRVAPFGEGTGAVVQASNFAIPVSLTGQQIVQTGVARADDTVDINGEVTFRAGDIPMVTKATDVKIDPAIVSGLVCACVRGVVVPAFGAGNSATGVISCGGELEDLDYVVTQDHHTDPLDGFETNPVCALDPDPDCSAENEVVPGVVSRACREQQDADCNNPAQNKHAGVCNSPRSFVFSGTGPRGSAIIFNNTSIGLLGDAGTCNMGIAGMDPCPQPSYGPDCIPCTDDDEDLGVPANNPTTTGTAHSRIVNLTNSAGKVIDQGSGISCASSDECSGSVCGIDEICLPKVAGDTENQVCGLRCGGSACTTVLSGTPFDCDLLGSTPDGGLSGGAFAVVFPSIDAALIGDNVTSTLFVFE